MKLTTVYLTTFAAIGITAFFGCAAPSVDEPQGGSTANLTAGAGGNANTGDEEGDDDDDSAGGGNNGEACFDACLAKNKKCSQVLDQCGDKCESTTTVTSSGSTSQGGNDDEACFNQCVSTTDKSCVAVFDQCDQQCGGEEGDDDDDGEDEGEGGDDDDDDNGTDLERPSSSKTK